MLSLTTFRNPSNVRFKGIREILLVGEEQRG